MSASQPTMAIRHYFTGMLFYCIIVISLYSCAYNWHYKVWLAYFAKLSVHLIYSTIGKPPSVLKWHFLVDCNFSMRILAFDAGTCCVPGHVQRKMSFISTTTIASTTTTMTMAEQKNRQLCKSNTDIKSIEWNSLYVTKSCSYALNATTYILFCILFGFDYHSKLNHDVVHANNKI